MEDVRDEIDMAVHRERVRQHEKWGEQNLPDGTGGEYFEMIAGLARDRCNYSDKNGSLTYQDILWEEVAEAFAEDDQENLKTELIQVMAVCKQWIQCIERRKK